MRTWLPLVLTALSISHGTALAPMKVLFWGGQSGIHNPQEQGNRFITAMKAVGIEVVYAGEIDNSGINDANLSKYDALVSYQQSGSPSITNSQIDALYRFVESGKGIIFTHMSIVAGAESDRYNKLVGGYFLDHGNGAYYAQPIQIDSSDISHPAFKGTPVWTSWDETYVNQIYPGSTVLQHRALQDKAPSDWTWVRNQGKGRVYYTSWGHDSNSWGNAGFMKQLEIALGYVTAPLRGGTTALEPILIFKTPEYVLAKSRLAGGSFGFGWARHNGVYAPDGKKSPASAQPSGGK